MTGDLAGNAEDGASPEPVTVAPTVTSRSPSGSGASDVDRDFTDHRAEGDYASHYSRLAWLQITIEGVYLLMMAAIAGVHMLGLAMDANFITHEVNWLAPATALPAPKDGNGVRLWMTVFFAGILGATTFSYKWLYHTVAWKDWHRDRIVWRFVVPLQGGFLAVGTGCMILAGIIPLLSKETFDRLASAAGYGFLVGLFADNFLAALQKFAKRLLGTLGQGS